MGIYYESKPTGFRVSVEITEKILEEYRGMSCKHFALAMLKKYSKQDVIYETLHKCSSTHDTDSCKENNTIWLACPYLCEAFIQSW